MGVLVACFSFLSLSSLFSIYFPISFLSIAIHAVWDVLKAVAPGRGVCEMLVAELGSLASMPLGGSSFTEKRRRGD